MKRFILSLAIVLSLVSSSWATHKPNPTEFYGVAWTEGASPTCSRTGNLKGVAAASKPDDSLVPVQASMRRCILDDSGNVEYYLDPTDSTKKLYGGASVLTGADGQVMVEIPLFYYRYSYAGGMHQWDISRTPLEGFYVHPAFMKDGAIVNYRYIGAYEGVLYDTSASRYANGIYISDAAGTFEADDDSITLTAPTNVFTNIEVGDKLTVSGTTSNNATVTVASIVSDLIITVDEALTDETDAAFVIGSEKDWTATTGDVLGSVSGKSPMSYGTRAEFRVAASNRGTGWRQQDYNLTCAIQLLYLVEYASFYAQSVLGAGITAVADWDAYNDNNPIAPTGNSNSIGNASGNTAGSTSSATELTKYLSYRGIENFFGHLWKWVDGFNINGNVPYVCTNEANYADDTTTNYIQIEDSAGSGITLHNANGYPTAIEQTAYGFLASAGSGSGNGTNYITDYYYQDTGWRVAALGGAAHSGASAGLFCWLLAASSGARAQYFSARLCY